MGCDYYVWIDTVIQYIDSSGNQQSLIEGSERQKRYNIISSDPDFEKDYTLSVEIEEYGKKVLFENGVWYCLENGKIRIQEICCEKKIPFDSIISVFKFKNGFHR
jgi:hypothetical protein